GGEPTRRADASRQRHWSLQAVTGRGPRVELGLAGSIPKKGSGTLGYPPPIPGVDTKLVLGQFIRLRGRRWHDQTPGTSPHRRLERNDPTSAVLPTVATGAGHSSRTNRI